MVVKSQTCPQTAKLFHSFKSTKRSDGHVEESFIVIYCDLYVECLDTRRQVRTFVWSPQFAS